MPPCCFLNPSKSLKNPILRGMKILMPLRIGFLSDCEGFWKQNGGMLASKIEQKSMLSSRGDFLEKLCFSSGKTPIFKDPGVEVGSKNRSKSDQNLKSNTKCLLASIFLRFWWISEATLASKTHPRSIKNGIEKTMKKKALQDGLQDVFVRVFGGSGRGGRVDGRGISGP